MKGFWGLMGGFPDRVVMASFRNSFSRSHFSLWRSVKFILVSVFLIVAVVVVVVFAVLKTEPVVAGWVKNNQVVFLDGEAESLAAADEGIQVKEGWLNGFTQKFMEDFDSPDSAVKVSVTYPRVDCGVALPEAKDCIDGSSDVKVRDYFFPAEQEGEVHEAALTYFKSVGLVPVFFSVEPSVVEGMVADKFGSGWESRVASGELNHDDVVNFRVGAVNSVVADLLVSGDESVFFSDVTSIRFCVKDTERLDKVAGAGFSENAGVNENGCVVGSAFILRSLGEDTNNGGVDSVSLSTSLGFKDFYIPEDVVQVEGRNYTFGEWSAVAGGDGETSTVTLTEPCSTVPSLIFPYWEEWPDGKLHCILGS